MQFSNYVALITPIMCRLLCVDGERRESSLSSHWTTEFLFPGEGLSAWPVHDTPGSDRTWPGGDLGLHGIPWSTRGWAPAPKDLCTPVHPREKPRHQQSFRTLHVSTTFSGIPETLPSSATVQSM